MRIEPEIRDQSNKSLDYVFGVIQKPGSRGQNFIFGWDGDGNPSLAVKTLAQEGSAITRKGHDTRGRNTVVAFPLDRELAGLAPKAFEFLEMAKPIDNRDAGTQFTEDVVNIACANGIGATSFLAVKELTLLKSIMDSQVTWQIGDHPSYSLIIPDQDAGTLNFVLFSPGSNPSNELTYRTFLLRVIKTLAVIDRNQNPPDQKGYVYVVQEVVRTLEELAQRERSQASPLQKIQMEMGLLDEIRGVALLNTLPVDKLRIVLREFKKVAEQSFAAGRR